MSSRRFRRAHAWRACIIVFRFVFTTTLVLLPATAVPAQSHWRDVQRVVAFGDLHGDYDQYEALLRLNGLVDEQLRWRGGNTHLVQLGDVPDRGADSLRIMRHLMRLQHEASRSGGAVHTLVGNHEAMNILGDLSYVHPGEYAALVTRRSARLQKDYLAKVYESRIRHDPSLPADRSAVMAQLKSQFPLGYVEHRVLWQSGGELAQWVAGNPAVVRINRTLFCHGGINPLAELMSIDAINASISAALRDANPAPDNLADRADGPLWYRGLAIEEESTAADAVDRMLDFYDADRIVIAHTPTRGRIVARFGGKVILADTGISAFYGSHAVNLVIEGDELYSQTPEGRERVVPGTPEKQRLETQ